MCHKVCLGVALSAFIALMRNSFSGAPPRQGERLIIFLNVYVYLAVSAGSRTWGINSSITSFVRSCSSWSPLTPLSR